MPAEEPESTKACLACAATIPTGAALCRHCHTYQDWRRHFDFSGVILSLLVALLAVATPFVSAVSEAYKSELGPQLEYTFQDGNLRRAHFLVHNQGDRAGMVADGFLKIDGMTYAVLTSPAGPTLIPPNSSALVSYFIEEPEFEYAPETFANNCQAWLATTPNHERKADPNAPATSTEIDCRILRIISNPSRGGQVSQ